MLSLCFVVSAILGRRGKGKHYRKEGGGGTPINYALSEEGRPFGEGKTNKKSGRWKKQRKEERMGVVTKMTTANNT